MTLRSDGLRGALKLLRQGLIDIDSGFQTVIAPLPSASVVVLRFPKGTHWPAYIPLVPGKTAFPTHTNPGRPYNIRYERQGSSYHRGQQRDRQETAFKFAAEQAKVVLTYCNDRPAGQTAEKRCRELCAEETLLIRLDLRDNTSILKAVDDVVKTFGKIDISSTMQAWRSGNR